MGKKAVQAKKCDGKARYGSEVAAERGIVRLREATGTKDLFTPYRCGFCPSWHFGHPPRKVRERLAEKKAA